MSVARAIPTVRRSLAEGLATCPAFVMERSERLAFGQAAHTYFAAYWRHLQALGEESDLIGWRALAIDAWARTPGLLQSRFDEFMELCERFAQTHLGDLDAIAAVEEPLTLDIGWALLVCTPDRIDRLDGGDPDDEATWERIVDYKTEVGEMDHEFQLFWYAQMRFLTRPALQRLDLVLDLVRRGRPHEPIPVERGELDDWWAATLQALRHRLDAGPGAPVGGPACEGCALRRSCGEAIGEFAIVPETDDEADRLLAEHRRLEAGAAARWSALKTYYADRPARVVNGEEIGFLETREPSFKVVVGPTEMRAWSVEHGMEGDALLTVGRITNRGLQDQLLAAGLAVAEFNKPLFKARKALAGTRVRRQVEDESDGR